MTTQAEYNQQLADLARRYYDKVKVALHIREVKEDMRSDGTPYLETQATISTYILLDSDMDGVSKLFIHGIRIHRKPRDIGPTLTIHEGRLREAFIRKYEAQIGGKLRKGKASYDGFQVKGNLSDIVDIAFNTAIQKTAIIENTA